MRADYRITGPTWFHTVQDQSRPTVFSALLPVSLFALLPPALLAMAIISLPSVTLLACSTCASVLKAKNWSLMAFADNMLDRKYINEAIPAIEFGGSFISPGARRLIGVEAGMKF